MNAKHRAAAVAEMRRTSGLNRLVETEESLEAHVREAREEAARIVERARDAAASARERLEHDLAPATEALLASITAEAETAARALERTRARQVAAYEGVVGKRLDPLARFVVARVIGCDTKHEVVP